MEAAAFDAQGVKAKGCSPNDLFVLALGREDEEFEEAAILIDLETDTTRGISNNNLTESEL